ncbi:uncharacterized protein ACA1_347360 [Acanthamoeba castellanii str. Neff]|uniref:Uncharacterized protein n=1 Tax=Acanthamoeba castellanii (strain ATCC 30010 / Neff) TaxID=1257118 RepID=L8GTA2_ACACF|nr:uncharacterized protein ACA1_347360 [Acanthamoeba castellanii str. Neff]ELR16230.1 hypothetical protein ACA1_347360 [Acanthamoeba castellanii str. Neff]
MDGGAEESGRYTYALQRWLFVGKGVPLRLVEEQPLFAARNEDGSPAVAGFLRLSFTLTPYNVMIVHGYDAGDKQLTTPHANYVSIVPCFGDSDPWTDRGRSVHLTYQVHASTCKYRPHLSFLPPKYLLLNTGCAIRIIEWELSRASTHEMPSGTIVRIRRQMAFDAEAYIGRMLRTNPVLRTCMLVDYEVEVARLLVENERALVLDPRVLHSFVFTFFLNCASGGMQLLSLRPAPCDQLATSLAQSLQQQWDSLPIGPGALCHTWTNDTVLSGKSLSAIPHHFYPLALCLLKNK